MSRPQLAVSAAVGPTPVQALQLAIDAQQWGYEAYWGAEVDGPDAFTMLGAIAASTDLELGVAVVPVQTRTAFVLAMSALSLSSLSGGRFSLGIGASSDVLVQRFGGIPYEKPLTWVRETVEALRPVFRGERTSLDGQKVRIGGYKSPVAPAGEIPILLGSLNPASLRMAGAIGDGICLNQMRVDHVPVMLDEVREGAAEAGRELPKDYPVVARLFCHVTDDPDPVKAMLPYAFGPYVATPGYNRFYQWQGYEEAADAIAAASAEGDKAGMAAGYTPDIVDDLFLIGSAEQIVERLEGFGEVGVTTAAIAPLSPDAVGAATTFQAIAEAWNRTA